jgi:uncharacterized protein (TIGR04255 family)
MAIGVQFHPLFSLRGIVLGPLRDRWRGTHPRVEEQPPLPPTIEAQVAPGINLQVGFGPVPNARYWFMSETGADIIQLQNDRIVVNWRRVDGGEPYPRYETMVERFDRALNELIRFVDEEELGQIEIVQAELDYINDVGASGAEHGVVLEKLLRGWHGTPKHHLGQPAQARLQLSFDVPDVGHSPVRMFVSVEPAMQVDGDQRQLMTLSVRGAPVDGSVAAALKFLDGAHEHLVQSFVELTPESIQSTWGLKT